MDIVEAMNRIADASKRQDGADIPLGIQLREAAAVITSLREEIERLKANAAKDFKLMSGYHALLTKLSAAPKTSDLYSFPQTTLGTWTHVNDINEMQAFYLSRLPAIREAAREHGYAIGVLGSQRRYFDLIAMQWRDSPSDKDTLAHAIANAACGISRDGPYQWEKKPCGREATSFPICWTDWHDMISAGHIDLSIIELARSELSEAETNKAIDYVIDERGNAHRNFTLVYRGSATAIRALAEQEVKP